VVAKIRERFAVIKQKLYRFHMERLNLKKLNEVEDKEQYCAVVSNRFTAMEDRMLRWILMVFRKLSEYKNLSQRKSILLCIEKAYGLVQQKMLKIIR
jgi:hypothetical protein